MGDRLATIDMGRKVGAAVPLSVGTAESPSKAMSPGSRPTDRQDRQDNGPVLCLLVCVCVCVCVSVFLSVCYCCFFLIVVFTYSAH